jgi:hypoxanthine phosphoribosyltransferase
MKEIRILDKTFRELIPEMEIREKVRQLASEINKDFTGKEVLFLGILNGAFLFAADLIRNIDIKARISFVKLASYEGTGSSGRIQELIGLNEDITNTNIIVVEDIVDTGDTLKCIMDELSYHKVSGIKITALLLKPDAYKKDIPIDYIGFKIPNGFVIGYGLDYNGYGRNYKSIYSLLS